ncbi:hydrogenase expression/formation protein HypE [Candidatus Acidulodesulfobacterium sp. H_13]|uniref:hydrogenase expression/formation protein HypE n=1 Tax=Candidatus Acidulodesulfobacterium sp. H_13 TaxID=3395470 RepID=UPI003AF53F41
MNYKKLNGDEKILLSHGGGGRETAALIKDILFAEFYGPDSNIINYDNGQNQIKLLEDAAILDSPKKIAFTTDSFTVSPIFFKGGDIGKLSVAGTVNDLSVMGAKPLFLSLGLIIEEGFLIEDLKRIINSVVQEAKKSGVKIVTGDTKVVPVGKADGIFINTSGIGKVLYENISVYNITDGDVVIVSGDIGDHGSAVMSQRDGIDMDVAIESDCASLWDMIELVLRQGCRVNAIRDATRGGLAAVLNEWASAAGINIHIEENDIPIKDSVKGFCEFLGFEPYQLACEGRVVFAVKPGYANRVIEILRSHPSGKNAKVIGIVGDKNRGDSRFKGKVILRGIYGVDRLLDYPSGELLPRIC